MPNDDRSNPLVSLVLTEDEHRYLTKVAIDHGVSIAQVVRGFLRAAMESYKGTTSKNGSLLEIIRAGAME